MPHSPSPQCRAPLVVALLSILCARQSAIALWANAAECVGMHCDDAEASVEAITSRIVTVRGWIWDTRGWMMATVAMGSSVEPTATAQLSS